MNKCTWHLCNLTLIGRQTRFCSPKCKNKFFVTKRRKILRDSAISYKGGGCSICSYNKCPDALHFHHVDPKTKKFGISASGLTRSWDKIKAELDKCVLLCANCHAEAHEKVTHP